MVNFEINLNCRKSISLLLPLFYLKDYYGGINYDNLSLAVKIEQVVFFVEVHLVVQVKS